MAAAGRPTVTFASDSDTLAHIWSQASDAGSESLNHVPSDCLSRVPSEADSLVRRRSSAAGDKQLLSRQASGGALLRKASSGAGVVGARRPGRLHLLNDVSPEAGEAVSALARGQGGGAALLRKASSSQGGGDGGAALLRKASSSQGGGGALLRAASSRAGVNDVCAEEQTVFETADEAARLHDVTFHFASMAALDMVAARGAAGGMLHVHNAVRAEIESVVTMLCALRRLGAQLTVGDLMLFHGWWGASAGVFADCLELHTRVVAPWLRVQLGAAPAPPALAAMPVEHCALRGLLDAVGTSFERAIEGSPRAGQCRRERLTVDLVVAFDRLITRLVTYLHALHVEVAAPLEAQQQAGGACADPDELREALLVQLMAECTRSAKQCDIVLLLLGRWADSKAQRRYAALLESATGHSYSKLSTHYEMHHGAMVAVFKVRAGIR